MNCILKNDISEVAKLNAFVRAACTASRMDESEAANVGLAVEEAVVNVMRYAYPEETKGEIRVKAYVIDDILTFEISDDGTPFDPTAAEGPDMTLSAKKRPIGGLGIYLMRQYMDTMSYKRMGNCNILSLTKNLNSRTKELSNL